MIIGHYNEYFLPNNNFLYRDEYKISTLRSKKNFKKVKQELSKNYGHETIESQPIFFSGVKTCVLAYIHDPHGNPSSIHYFLHHLKINGLSEEEHELFTVGELYEIFKTNLCLIHIYNFGLINLESEWIEFEAHFMNNLYSVDLSMDFSKKTIKL